MIRVTELLRWAGVTAPIPMTAAVQTAMRRGTAVHEWSVMVERDRFKDGGAIVSAMPLPLRGYGRAVAAFVEAYRPQWSAVESRIDDPAIDLTGCPDRVGVINDEQVIVDYKTGGRSAWHRLQVALYAILVERSLWTPDGCTRFNKRLIVYLSPDGTYRLASYAGRQDILEAWSLITRYRKEVAD
jgi:hypothetical protein